MPIHAPSTRRKFISSCIQYNLNFYLNKNNNPFYNTVILFSPVFFSYFQLLTYKKKDTFGNLIIYQLTYLNIIQYYHYFVSLPFFYSFFLSFFWISFSAYQFSSFIYFFVFLVQNKQTTYYYYLILSHSFECFLYQ